MNINFKGILNGMSKSAANSLKAPSFGQFSDVSLPGIKGFDMPSINPSSMLGDVNSQVPNVSSAMPDMNSEISKASSDAQAAINVDPESYL